MTKARQLEKLDAEVERWNKAFPVGSHIPDLKTETASAAFIHHKQAMVFLNTPFGAVFLSELPRVN